MKPIYVEISLDEATIEDVWEATQNPTFHAQWDLRFSSITYLPKENEDSPQSFLYETNVFPCVKIAGWGSSFGTHQKENGTKTSSLQFGTNQLISPIKEGRGYWQYIPKEKGLTFLTQYDYDVRFGLIGRLFDLFFRPLMGWATALSFDVLRRWVEKGEIPYQQYIRFFMNTLLVAAFFFVWFYQGLVPKIIAHHPEEIAMLSSLTLIKEDIASLVVTIIGALEILFALIWLFYRKKQHLYVLQIALFPILTISAILAAPENVAHPFNPVTFNVSLWTLSIIGLFLTKDLPTAKNCKRKRTEAS